MLPLQMLLGAIFCSIPMRKSDEVVTLVPGAVLIACGIAQLIIGTCVTKVRGKECGARARPALESSSGSSDSSSLACSSFLPCPVCRFACRRLTCVCEPSPVLTRVHQRQQLRRLRQRRHRRCASFPMTRLLPLLQLPHPASSHRPR